MELNANYTKRGCQIYASTQYEKTNLSGSVHIRDLSSSVHIRNLSGSVHIRNLKHFYSSQW